MRNITFIIFLLCSLFSQNEIEGRWHLVGYEDAIMYQFVDTEPFADAGLRYSIYVDENGEIFENAKGESDTIAGFCIEQAGKILLKNEKINFDTYTITVEAADKRRIKKVKITINETT